LNTTHFIAAFRDSENPAGNIDLVDDNLEDGIVGDVTNDITCYPLCG
jgi:hypothetical protein